MLLILLGEDDFSKKEHIKVLATKEKAEVEFIVEEEKLDILHLTEQDLFAKPKIFVVENLFKALNLEKNLDKLLASQNHIIITEEKLDKRSSFNKKLLSNKKITVKAFSLPHGRELNKWVEKRVLELGGKISKEAAEELAVKLGRDEGEEIKVGGKVISSKERFSLWQADGEIKKLIAFAQGKEITKADVESLVTENLEIDVFKITNAIADGKKKEAISLMRKFLAQQTGSDEKARIIQLNALLAEQFRNVFVVQDFVAQKTPEQQILEKTGWKSGRVFVMKKIANKFNPKKVLVLLKKLEALDQELKTTQTPPKVLLDLILAQLF